MESGLVVAAGKLAIRTMLLGVAGLCRPLIPLPPRSRSCRQLEADLACAVGGGRASPAQVEKIRCRDCPATRAIAQARGRANDAGCGFSLVRRNVADCASLNASLRQNGGQSRRTAAQARAAGRRWRASRSHARILAALDANGCRNARSRRKQNKKPPRQNRPNRFTKQRSYQSRDCHRTAEEDQTRPSGSRANTA